MSRIALVKRDSKSGRVDVLGAWTQYSDPRFHPLIVNVTVDPLDGITDIQTGCGRRRSLAWMNDWWGLELMPEAHRSESASVSTRIGIPTGETVKKR